MNRCYNPNRLTGTQFRAMIAGAISVTKLASPNTWMVDGVMWVATRGGFEVV